MSRRSDWYEALGAEATASKAVIKKCQSEWYLVNLVDNNYLSSDLFHTLVDVVSKGQTFNPPTRA